MDGSIVPSCIKCNGRLCIVRSNQVANRTTKYPSIAAHTVQMIPITINVPDGTAVMVENGFTISGLAVTNSVLTVKNKEIWLPIHNLTTEKSQVVPDKIKITYEVLDENEILPIEDTEPLGRLLAAAQVTEVEKKADSCDPPEKTKHLQVDLMIQKKVLRN